MVSFSAANERHARALSKVPESKRAEVVAAASKLGKVTTHSLEAAAKKMGVLEAELGVLDKIGKEIPAAILSEWNRAWVEAREARRAIDHVAQWFSHGLEEREGKKRDPIFRAVTLSNQKLFTDIKRQIAMVEPYAVCPSCRGATNTDGALCRQCKGTGFISKFEFDTVERNKK